MKTLLTLLALLSLTLTAAAQPPDTLWTRTFGGSDYDGGLGVQQTSDGGYVIVGETHSYGAGDDDVYLIKTDAAGNLEWQCTYGGSISDGGYSVQQTFDGGYVIAGWTYSISAGYSDVYLIKTDGAGNLIWQRNYGGSENDYGYCVQQTADGGYIIAGTTSSFGSGNEDIYLIKTDAWGNSVWQRTFGGTDTDYGYCLQQTSDGGYVIAGVTGSYGTGNGDVYLIKTDDAGNQIWQRTFSGSGAALGSSVQQTSDGGYIITSSTYSYSTHFDVFLIKTDANGHQSWQGTFGGSGNDFGYSVRQTSDGGYVIAGETTPFGTSDGNIYLIKTDAAGSLVWQSTYGGSDRDYGFNMQQTSEGGYIVAGYTSSYGAGSGDIYLIKTDAGGGALSVATTPINPPITIPRNGGSFQYNININNLTTAPQSFSLWNMVRNSAGQYTQVFGPITRTLQGGANPTRILTQNIARTISSGTLYFISYVGTYPNTVQDSSFFTITKSTVSDGGPWISESNGYGDLFDEFKDGNGGTRSVVSLSGSGTTPTTEVMPNPFNPTTTIRFTLPEAARVTLEVFDIQGRVVGVQHVEPLQAGSHEIVFDGSGLPSGVYLYRLTAGAQTASGKMVLMK